MDQGSSPRFHDCRVCTRSSGFVQVTLGHLVKVIAMKIREENKVQGGQLVNLRCRVSEPRRLQAITQRHFAMLWMKVGSVKSVKRA